jgi:hypothetical protein
MSSLEDAEAAENAGSWSGVCWAVEPVERPEEADAWAGEEQAEGAGVWAGERAEEAGVRGVEAAGAVETGGGPVDRRAPAGRRSPVCMGGTGTESGMSIMSSSIGDEDCCRLDTEKSRGKGKLVSSKTTWREIMMRRDSRSMQR